MRLFGRKLFIPGFILTLVYGVIYYILGEIIVKSLFNNLWNPLAVAIYVVLFAILLIPILLLIARGSGNMQGGLGGFFAMTGLLLVILFMSTLLLEFLYELGGKVSTYTPTSYIFVIDDSASMSYNDFENERVSAIPEIMEGESIPYAVYKFSDDATLIRDMDMYQGADNLSFASDGIYTDVLNSLYTVSQGIKAGEIDGGQRPKILLLSDGDSYADGLEDVLKEFNDLGISVSTVGFGDANDTLMTDIAEGTGGVYIKCTDLNALKDDIERSISSFSTRTLLTPRRRVKWDALYMILRILFLTIIGVIISFIKRNGAFDSPNANLLLIISASQGLVAAILCEFIVRSRGGLARLLLVLLWAFMTLGIEEYQSVFGNSPIGGGNNYENKPNINGTPHTLGGPGNNGGSQGYNNGYGDGGFGGGGFGGGGFG